jgi:hypothetical protein
MYDIFCKDNNQGKDFVSCLLKRDEKHIFSEDTTKSISQSLEKIANKSLSGLQNDYLNLLVSCFSKLITNHTKGLH